MKHPLGMSPDVRILTPDPEVVRERLHLAGLMFAADLQGYDGQRDQYAQGALVPDPRSIQPCPPSVAGYLVHSLAEHASHRRKTDVIVYAGDSSKAVLNGIIAAQSDDRWFGTTVSPLGQLTTTLNTKIKEGSNKEGVHFDDGEQYGHRLGVCAQGPRQLLVGLHGASLLHGDAPGVLTTGAVRERLACDPVLLRSLACLFISLESGEGYDAYTERVLHDGATMIFEGQDGRAKRDAPPDSTVVFARLD